MRELIKLELRKTLPYYILLSGAMLIFVVFRHGVLSPRDPWLALISAMLGAVLAFRIFTDPPGTRAFLFSRPFTRQRLFLIRWAIGLALIVVALLLAATCLAAGTRALVQTQLLRSPWFPMVRWHELNSLWLVACSALLTYGATMLLVIKHDVVMSESPISGRLYQLFSIGSALFLFCFGTLGIMVSFVPMGGFIPISLPLILAYVVLVTITSVLASLHGYRVLPVES